MWTGAILAGGRSRRLGGLNKAALKIGNATVLDRQLAKGLKIYLATDRETTAG